MPLNLLDMDEKNYNGYDVERFNNYENEADEIRSLLKTDHAFCQRFFFGKDLKKCNIARFRNRHIAELLQTYNVKISDDTYSTIVYEALWANGTWAPLDSYDKQSTFFAWLRRVARNAVMERLEDEHIIPENRLRTVGNTRLTMLSQSEGKCKVIIDDLMKHTRYYELLTAIYVDRITEEETKKKLNLTGEEYKSMRKQGERLLKDALLRTTYSFEEDILHDKNLSVIKVSSEFVMDMAEWYRERTNENPFSDVLGFQLSDYEVKKKVVSFIYDFSARLKWTDEDRYIWRKRFLENMSPVKLAEEMGVDRHWVDLHYSRINKKFKEALKKWWIING